MDNYQRELDVINNKINNDDKLIYKYQLNGISQKKIKKIEILREKHLRMKAKIEDKL